ncbi:MAG: hypothetical protein GC165_01245 [Armatimonadetes bacterium]|nr:hypothetical protein [Armatimonadota bacterium]
MGKTEESRQQLRDLLSRRDFMYAAGGALAAMSLFGLMGCGGGGTGGIADSLVSVSGVVTLPNGSSLDLSTMTVDVMGLSSSITSPNQFSAQIPSNSPSLALLVDSGGEGVLMAMLDPAGTSHAISAHTTAVTLLYYATSAYLFPGTAMAKILSLLDGDPAIAALEAAVASAIVSDPHALANNASGLGQAITDALTTILGGPSGNVTHGLAAVASPATPNVPTLMYVSPTDEQNGVMVNQDATTTSLLISNSKRRPCKVYVYETTTLTVNQTADINPAKKVAGPFDLDSTENLSLFTSLKDFTTFFHGTSPWSPVNLPAIPLALETGTDRTTYHVVVLASSFKTLGGDAFEPAFFHDSHYVNELAKWRQDNANLFYVSLFGDILLPIFCFFGGFGCIVAARSVVAAAVLAPAAVASATFARVISQLEYGSIPGVSAALATIVRDAISSDTSTQFWKEEIRQVIGAAEAKALESASLAATGTRLSKASKMFLSVFEPIFAAGLLLDGFDLGAVILDVYNSDLGTAWNALLIRQSLNLRPQNPVIHAGERVSFAITAPANSNGNFEYDWTQTSGFATLSAVGEVNVGNKITTKQLTVDLITTGSDTQPIEVLVIGYDTSSGQRVEVGRSGTTVKFLIPAQILPTSPLLQKGEHQTFTVEVSGGAPNGVKYRWTLTGNAGTIGSSPVTTSAPMIAYTATADGSDILHVDVLDLNGNVIANADNSITVGATPKLDLTIAGTWDPNQTPPNGTYHLLGPDPNGGRQPVNSTTDALSFVYGVTSTGNDAATMLIAVGKGQTPTVNQTFTRVPPGTLMSVGQFVMSLDTNLNNPDDPNSSLYPVGTGGTLTVQGVSVLNNGNMLIQYSTTVTNSSGGTVVATGFCVLIP